MTTLPNHDSDQCAQAGGACAPARHVGQPLDLDPVDVFAKLVREVDAGRALVTMTPAGDQRRAALDALTLARDVLDDARQMLDPTTPWVHVDEVACPACAEAARRVMAGESLDDLPACPDAVQP